MEKITLLLEFLSTNNFSNEIRFNYFKKLYDKILQERKYEFNLLPQQNKNIEKIAEDKKISKEKAEQIYFKIQFSNYLRVLKELKDVIKGKNIYRAMIIQDLNSFINELKEYHRSTPHPEAYEFMGEKKFKQERIGVGKYWSWDYIYEHRGEELEAYGGYIGEKDIPIIIEAKITNILSLDFEGTMFSNFHNFHLTEQEIRLYKESYVFATRLWIRNTEENYSLQTEIYI